MTEVIVARTGRGRIIARRFFVVAAGSAVAMLGLSVMLTLPLRWVNPATTSFILQDGSARSAEMRRNWTSIASMSPHLPISVVASEDQKFPYHRGFDFESISEAMSENRTRARGASTITMQLAKNLYLWPGRSMIRKGIEAWFTVLLELFIPKDRILEIYLNVVEFGPGVYGAESASRVHFGKSVGQLGPYESALLAAVLPSPRRMSAGRPSAYVRGRAVQIQSEVRRLGGVGYLTTAQPPSD